MGSLLIGVISDTHGLIRTEALEVLKGVEVIFHGGDIGGIEVLKALGEIAPVVAVRGNCDRDEWSKDLPVSRKVEIANKRFLLVHQLQDLKNLRSPLDAVIFGHSHKATIYEKDKILYFNPGSAGPKRFKLSVTVGRIWAEQGKLMPEIVELF